MTKILKSVVLAVSLLVLAAAAFAGSAQYRLDVKGLACPFCAYGIEKQLRKIEGVAAVETHIKEGAVLVNMEDDATLDEATAKKAIKDAGFTLGGFQKTEPAE